MAENCCSTGTRLLYTCSGGADVGELSDRVGRHLKAEGFGNMTCLAGVGADLSGFVQSAKGAERVIAIDGCPMVCARKALERHDVTPVSYILTDYEGVVKGSTPCTPEQVTEISDKIINSYPDDGSAPAEEGRSCC